MKMQLSLMFDRNSYFDKNINGNNYKNEGSMSFCAKLKCFNYKHTY